MYFLSLYMSLLETTGSYKKLTANYWELLEATGSYWEPANPIRGLGLTTEPM